MSEETYVPEDFELVTLAKGGETEAFGVLYERYVDPIYRYIRVRVSEDETAEDLTELVFLRSFKSLDRYKERGLPFSAFLYRIAKNLIVDHYREQKEEVSLEAVAEIESSAQPMDERVMITERVEEVQRALVELPSDYQEVIRLRVLLELPTETTADWLNRSEGAVRVLLHRALKAVRERVSEDNDEG
ncbi:MAG: sigma-70 family RNA polymerase sigma factor [Anaerolineales bacterium]|nr:sigma-70 family RNA polymerase sigma factor [Anaerolineales bacterium]